MRLSRRGGTRAASVALLFMLVACGVRTEPRPPEDTAARAPGDFEVARRDTGIELSWERPTRTADGERLYDLSGFRVERAEGAGDFAPIATLSVTDNDRIRTQRTFRYLDESAAAGPLRYRVRALHADGELGEASELLLVGDAAPAPTVRDETPLSGVTDDASNAAVTGEEPARDELSPAQPPSATPSEPP